MPRSFKEQLLQAGLLTAEQIESIEQRDKSKPTGSKSATPATSRSSVSKQRTERAIQSSSSHRNAASSGQHSANPPHSRSPVSSSSASATSSAQALLDSDELLAKYRLTIPVKGQRRWYIEATDGRILYLSISDTCGELLEQGQAAIVELTNGTHRIINRDGASFLQQQHPSCIRYWNPIATPKSTTPSETSTPSS